MKQRLIGIFNNIGDAKNALGQIKKESWNQTELTVIVKGKNVKQYMENNGTMEIAAKNFIENPVVETGLPIFWPGLKEEWLPGIGTVKIGYNSTGNQDRAPLPFKFGDMDLDFIKTKLAADKVVAVIETENLNLPKLRYIMEINGAELISENI